MRRARAIAVLFGTDGSMLALLRFSYRLARGPTLALLALTLLASASTVLLTVLVGRVVATVHRGSSSGFAWLLAATIAVFLATSILPVWRSVVAVELEVRLDRAIAAETLAPLLSPPGVAHLDDPEVQDTYARAAEVDLVQLNRGPGLVAALLGSRLVIGGSAFVVGAYLAWWLVPILVGSVLVVEWRTILATDTETAAWAGQTRGQRRARYLYHLALVEGIHELRIFGLARWLAERHSAERDEALAPLQRLRWRFARARLGLLAVHAGIHTSALVLAVWSAWTGRLSLGAMSAAVPAILLVATGYDPANLANLRRALAAFRAMRSLPELVAGAYPPRPGRVADLETSPRTVVRLDNVCFRYPGQDHDVLHDLDLELRSGEAHALVGLNGAGKSTLVKLLAGGYQPTAGRITVDGIDLGGLDAGSLAAWQRRVAVVVQDFLRLPVSVSANIAFDRDVDPPAGAAGQAGLEATIAGLPGGWDTILDRTVTGGAELSGGQWQRLALARALHAVHAGAGLLVLDEPAAALDVRAEADLVDRYLRLTEGVTSLVISHRFSVVRGADRISVLDGGRIVESGTHDELMTLGGRYASMFRLQADRYGVENA